MKNNVYMGTLVDQWMPNKNIKYITFNVTDDCNLACKYCYFTHKTNKNVMSFEVASKAIDSILCNSDFLIHDGVVWDFIGGEPTLELDLIEKICDYVLLRMYQLNHKWLYCYRFLIGSNGLLYSHPKMQKIIKKHGMNLQVNITIDGSKEKHDLSRVRKDGSGSYDDIIKQIPLWQAQQGGISTKATFAHDDLPYLKDSIINLWNHGIKNVMANVVFENVWEPGDDQILKEQLIALADYVVEHNLWDEYSVRFFDPNIGMPVTEKFKSRNFCGTGKMLAISTQGDYYPCARFLDSAFNNHKGLTIGSIDTGWDNDRLRAFKLLDATVQSSQECLNCEIASGCTWCSAFNYDDSQIGTLFERKTYICKMHKATVEACRYLWRRYEEVTGKVSPMRLNYLKNTSDQHKFMYIVLNSHSKAFCNYVNKRVDDSVEIMDEETINRALKFCDENNFSPIFIGDAENRYKKYGYSITDNLNDDLTSFSTSLIVDHDQLNSIDCVRSHNIVLSTSVNSLNHLKNDIEIIVKHSKNTPNISLAITDFFNFSHGDLLSYKCTLYDIADFLVDCWRTGNFVELNVITHIFHFTKHKECKAGTYSITLAPDNNFYICPAFYFEKNSEVKSIGDLFSGISNNYEKFCSIEKSKLCKTCDAYHCSKCVSLCKAKTNEFCVAPEILCLKSNIEREVSRYFYDLISKDKVAYRFENKITSPLKELDPLLRLENGDEL